MSLLLRRSPEAATRLAVTGAPAGMSTRALLPATALISGKYWGGGGATEASWRSDAWILVRALMLFLATTTFVPAALLVGSRERLARPAAVANASTARIAPITM